MGGKAALPKYGVQIKTQWNCKICQSPKRTQIEDVLAVWKAGDKLPNGIQPTLRWITDHAPELWDFALNQDNIKSHLKRHFQITGAAGALQTRQNADVEAIREAAVDIVPVAVDEGLQEIVNIGMATIRQQPERITPDHVLKAISELTRRKTNDRDALLMGALVEALSKPKQAAPAGEVIEAEIVAEILPPEERDAESG